MVSLILKHWEQGHIIFSNMSVMILFRWIGSQTFLEYKYSLALQNTCYQKQLIFLTLQFLITNPSSRNRVLTKADWPFSLFFSQRNGCLLAPNKDIFFSIGSGRMLVSGSSPVSRERWLTTHAKNCDSPLIYNCEISDFWTIKNYWGWG